MLGMLILENFKAFGPRQSIPLAPITLIFGPNSAGKRSILQSLLLLKQTQGIVRGSDIQTLDYTGWLVDLGGFKEMVYQHNVRKTCEITPLLGSRQGEWPALISRYWAYALRPKHAAGIGFRFDFDDSTQGTTLRNVPFYWDGGGAFVYQLGLLRKADSSPCYEDIARIGTGFWRIKTDDGSDRPYGSLLHVEQVSPDHKLLAQMLLEAVETGLVEETLQRLGSPSQPVEMQHAEISTLNHEVTKVKHASEENTQFARWLMLYSNDRACHWVGLWADELFPTPRQVGGDPDDLPGGFLSHLRGWTDGGYGEWLEAERPCLFPDLIGISIEFSRQLWRVIQNISYIGPLRELPERVTLHSGQPSGLGSRGEHLTEFLYGRPELLKDINRALADLALGYSLDVQKVRESIDKHGHASDVVSLRVTDDTTGITVGVRDAGLGVSQVLPVVAQSLLARDSVVLIEQPELHLHPRLQAELGSLVAQRIREPYNNQFLIETHSEKLILRLQRLIRRQQLRASDVSVVYITRHEGSARCVPLRLDEKGDFIDEWPDGFFEEGFREMFE